MHRRIPLSVDRNPDILCNREPGSSAYHHKVTELGKGACSACCLDGTTVFVNRAQYRGYVEAGTDVRLLAVGAGFDDWQGIPPYGNLDELNMRDMKHMRKTLKFGEAMVVFVGKCGYLDTSNLRCNVFNQPKRSRSCSSFEDGSLECLSARERAGYVDITYASGRVIVPQNMPGEAQTRTIDPESHT